MVDDSSSYLTLFLVMPKISRHVCLNKLPLSLSLQMSATVAAKHILSSVIVYIIPEDMFAVPSRMHAYQEGQSRTRLNVRPEVEAQ